MSKTYHGSVTSTCKIIVPDSIIAEWRNEASVNNSGAIFQAAKRFPDDDEAFVAAVLKNGLRTFMQLGLADLIRKSGFMGSASPASITLTGHRPKPKAEAVAVSNGVGAVAFPTTSGVLSERKPYTVGDTHPSTAE